MRNSKLLEKYQLGIGIFYINKMPYNQRILPMFGIHSFTQ